MKTAKMFCLDPFTAFLYISEFWGIEWQRKVHKHIPNSFAKSWNGKMDYRQDFTHLALASSQSPSGLTVGKRTVKLGHLDTQAGEGKIHHLVKQAMDPANCASILVQKMFWWDIMVVCIEFSKLKFREVTSSVFPLRSTFVL